MITNMQKFTHFLKPNGKMIKILSIEKVLKNVPGYRTKCYSSEIAMKD